MAGNEPMTTARAFAILNIRPSKFQSLQDAGRLGKVSKSSINSEILHAKYFPMQYYNCKKKYSTRPLFPRINKHKCIVIAT